MKQEKVNLQSSSCSIKLDAPIQDFKYFTNIIQNNIYQQWILEKKVEKIEDKLQQFISDKYKQDYVLIISVKPAYNLSHKKNRYMIIKIEDVTIIIYQAKPVDYYQINLSKQIQKKYETHQKDTQFKEPDLILKKNLTQDECQKIDTLKQIITEIAQYDTEEWEIDLVKVIKQSACAIFQSGYWHVFCSKKISMILQQDVCDKYLEFSFTKKQNQQYKLILFQKRGPNFNLFEKIRLKIREIISFIVLLTFFLLLTSCKNITETINSQSTIKEQICSYRSELFGVCAIILFGLVAQRLINKKKSKMKSN